MAENQSTVENAKEKLDRWLKDGITTPGGKLLQKESWENCWALNVWRCARRCWTSRQNPKSSVRIVRGGSWPSRDLITVRSCQRAFSGPQLSKDESLLGVYREKPYQRYSRDARATDCSDTINWTLSHHRLGALEGHKVFYHETYINPEVAPGFIEQLENHSFSAVWEKCYQKETVVKNWFSNPSECRAISASILAVLRVCQRS